MERSILGGLALLLGLLSTASSQPINDSWVGVWESTEPQRVFNKKTRREEKKIERIAITSSTFNNCVWSVKRAVVRGELDCHASYTGVTTLAQLTTEFGTSEFARHLKTLSPEKPFRIIEVYTLVGSHQCGSFYIWDRGSLYSFSTQCPTEQDTRSVARYTRVGGATQLRDNTQPRR